MADVGLQPIRRVPPWIFAITATPFGIVGAFCGTTMPYLTSKAHIAVEDIGWFGFATMVPPMVQFLYSPIVDIGPKRRVWLVIVSTLGAACMCGAMTMRLPDQINAFMGLTVAAQLISGLVGSCNGGLMVASLADEDRGKASGWLNAGNLGGGTIGVAAALQMQDTYRPLTVGLVLAVLMVVPSLAALFIPEPERVAQSAKVLFGTMLRDVWGVLRSRAGFTGVVLCISPVGTAALVNYFSSLADDYHASKDLVTFVNGPLTGVVSAAGALLGGYLCDRMNRRAAYLGSGGLTAVVGIGMALCPLTSQTYAVGVGVYLFVSGLCYAAFSAFVLEIIGTATTGAATQYTIFTAAANCAIGYVGLLDTRFHKDYGARGLLVADASANVLGIVVLLGLMALLLRRSESSAPPAVVG